MDHELEQLRGAALDELRRQPRAQPWWREAARLAALNLGVSLVVMAALVSASWSLHPRLGELLWWWGALQLAAVATLGGVLALRPGGRAAQVGVLALAAATVPLLIAALAGPVAEAPSTGELSCAGGELAVSLVPALAMAAALSRFAWQPLRAVAGGVAAGATGLLVLHLSCPVGAVSHLLLFHLAPSAVVIGALVLLRARRASESFVP